VQNCAEVTTTINIFRDKTRFQHEKLRASYRKFGRHIQDGESNLIISYSDAIPCAKKPGEKLLQTITPASYIASFSSALAIHTFGFYQNCRRLRP